MTNQPSVIQWNAAKWEEAQKGSSATSHTNLEPIIKEYIDMKIEIMPDKPSCPETSQHAEYLDIRICMEPEHMASIPCESKRGMQHTNASWKGKCKRASYTLQDRPFKCGTCSKRFITRQHLERHSNLHSMEVLYTCHLCGKVLLDKSYLLRHMRVHEEEKPYGCKVCEKKFRSASSMRRHSTTHDHSLRPYFCPDCGKRFPNNSSLKKHALTHSGVKAYLCTICAKGFSHVGDYNIHMRGHDLVKPYHCEECGKAFSRQNNLIRHKAVHVSDGRFKCTMCNVSFQHASTLTRHVLDSHPETAKVKKKKGTQSECQELKTTSTEEQVHYDPESFELYHDDRNIHENVSVAPQENSKEAMYNMHVEKDHDSAEQIELIRSSPSSFQIYEFDASGNLVQITNTASI